MNKVEKSKRDAINSNRITDDIISHIDKYPEDYEFQSAVGGKIYFRDKQSNDVYSLSLNKEYHVYDDLVTDETFIKLYESVDTSHFGSDQTPLFDIGAIKENPDDFIPFNDKNWNSGQDILRYFIMYIEDTRQQDNMRNINMRYLYKNIEGDRMAMLVDDVDTVFMITWYKNRGRTTSITKDGQPINYSEYKDLINRLALEDTFREILKDIINDRITGGKQ